MGKLGASTFFAVATLAIAVFLPVTAVAHDAGTFTVLVKDDQLTPNEPQLIFNDSVWWYNVDSTENVTHRIVYDADGDGLYNGTLDWDSGNLTSECEKDEYGNLTDPDCRITYEIPFNGTWGVGTYNYQDILSTGVINNGTIIVLPDSHDTDENSPPISGYEFGNDEEEQELDSEEGGEDSRDWLLWVAAGSGLIALLLIGVLLLGMNSNDFEHAIDDISEDE